MNRIELEEIACGSCGKAQGPKRFKARCPACGQDRFRVRVRRTVKGFDPGAMEVRLDWLLWFGDLALLIQAAVDGPGSMIPFHSWTSTDDFEDVAGEAVAKFLELPDAGRRRLYHFWKRSQVEAGLPENRAVCRRCELIFVSYANRWHREGYCSRKCFETDALSLRSKR